MIFLILYSLSCVVDLLDIILILSPDYNVGIYHYDRNKKPLLNDVLHSEDIIIRFIALYDKSPYYSDIQIVNVQRFVA